MKMVISPADYMPHIDRYMSEMQDEDKHVNTSAINQLRKLQKIANDYGYGNLFDLSKEELVTTLESSGAIVGEAIYRLIYFVRRFTVWAYEKGIIQGQDASSFDIKKHPAITIELNDIHVRNAYPRHIFKEIEDLLKFIYCSWEPGAGQYAPVVAALCWCGIPYKDCANIKSKDVFLSSDCHILYHGKRIAIPPDLVPILRDYKDTDRVEKQCRGLVTFYAAKTEYFIKMFVSNYKMASQKANKVSISRDLHAAVDRYNKMYNANMDIDGADIYLSGRLCEAKKIYDAFGNITNEELGDLFYDGTKTTKRKIARIRYSFNEYIAFRSN